MPTKLRSNPMRRQMRLVGSFAVILGCSGPPQDILPPLLDQPVPASPTVVHLDSTAVRLANITIGEVTAVRSVAAQLTGMITYDAARVSLVGSRAEGRVVELRADVGDHVERGAALAILESVAVGRLRAQYEEGTALVRIAQENYLREKRLEERGITSRKEMLTAEADLRRMEAQLHSTVEGLRVLGAEPGEGSLFPLSAPIAGTVVERTIGLGSTVFPTSTLFTVADLSRLWILLDIYERELSHINVGSTVRVTTPAYPGRVFNGRLAVISGSVDSVTRTAQARVVIANPDGTLKPGMFVEAEVELAGPGELVLTVPRNAVQQIDGDPSVFVPGAEPGVFRMVRVVLGAEHRDGSVVVKSGLTVGAEVVVGGAFALRSELSRGDVAEHGH